MKAQLKKIKKYLESHAELAWGEEKTKTYIISQLGKDYVWSEKTALVYKVGKGPAVFFRAELDGLVTGISVQHACGHAGHIAALMGAYLYFKNRQPKNYTIYFVFQPAEEGYPSGAAFLSERFIPLKHCKAGFAFHVYPHKEEGVLIDPIFAAADYFEITIEGKGTHIKNKYTNTATDALIVASDLVLRINTKKFSHALINVGVLTAGETPNSIASHAVLKGDVRGLQESARLHVKKWLEAQVKKCTHDTKISLSLLYNQAYPLLSNDPTLLTHIKKVLPIKEKLSSYASEDFSLYPIPTVFLLIGTGSLIELHQEDFGVEDTLLMKLFAYWVQLGTAIENKKLPFGSFLNTEVA